MHFIQDPGLNGSAITSLSTARALPRAYPGFHQASRRNTFFRIFTAKSRTLECFLSFEHDPRLFQTLGIDMETGQPDFSHAIWLHDRRHTGQPSRPETQKGKFSPIFRM